LHTIDTHPLHMHADLHTIDTHPLHMHAEFFQLDVHALRSSITMTPCNRPLQCTFFPFNLSLACVLHHSVNMQSVLECGDCRPGGDAALVPATTAWL
jgi:hypothetical protein